MQSKNRIPEIDLLRGIAILLMVIFHTIVDLQDFYSYDINYHIGLWYFEGKIAAIGFMLVAGISSTLSKNSLKHGIQIFCWGMLLTAITYIYDPEIYIRFGILHFLGCSLLSYPLIRSLQPISLIALAVGAVVIGIVFSELTLSSPYFLPIGLKTSTFASMDYYPLFPWYGVFLLGVATGKTIYPVKKSIFPAIRPNIFIYAGQHSLFIYLIHQPVLLAVLFILHYHP